MKYIALLLTFMSMVSAYEYHGCALAPDNLHGWVVCIDTVLILHTSDGGMHWQPQAAPNDSFSFFDVTCIDANHAWACGILGEIIHTENGGTTWSLQHLYFPKYATRIEFLDVDYGWTACGDAAVIKTTDAGNYWERVFTPWGSAEYYGVSFVNPMDGWLVAGWPDTVAIGQGLILRSSDGGTIWDSLYQSLGYEDYLDVYFFDLLNGIVVGGDDQNHNPIILKTTNGGLNWNPISAPPNTYYLRAVDFIDNKGWAVGNQGTIIYTSDYGNTWTFQANPAEGTLYDIDFSDGLHGIACGHDIILYTTDGGGNWFGTTYGLFGYTVYGTNNSNSSITFQYWTDIILWNGNPYPGNPIFGPLQVTLPPGPTRSRHLSHVVPANTPLKTYTCYGRVGWYPNDVWGEDSFQFTVVASDSDNNGIEDWQTIDE